MGTHNSNTGYLVIILWILNIHFDFVITTHRIMVLKKSNTMYTCAPYIQKQVVLWQHEIQTFRTEMLSNKTVFLLKA